jgi:hypothetical protein
LKLPGTADIEDKLAAAMSLITELRGRCARMTAGSSTWLWSGKS